MSQESEQIFKVTVTPEKLKEIAEWSDCLTCGEPTQEIRCGRDSMDFSTFGCPKCIPD